MKCWGSDVVGTSQSPVCTVPTSLIPLLTLPLVHAAHRVYWSVSSGGMTRGSERFISISVTPSAKPRAWCKLWKCTRVSSDDRVMNYMSSRKRIRCRVRNERGRGTHTEKQVEKTKERDCKLKLRLTLRERECRGQPRCQGRQKGTQGHKDLQRGEGTEGTDMGPLAGGDWASWQWGLASEAF